MNVRGGTTVSKAYQRDVWRLLNRQKSPMVFLTSVEFLALHSGWTVQHLWNHVCRHFSVTTRGHTLYLMHTCCGVQIIDDTITRKQICTLEGFEAKTQNIMQGKFNQWFNIFRIAVFATNMLVPKTLLGAVCKIFSFSFWKTRLIISLWASSTGTWSLPHNWSKFWEGPTRICNGGDVQQNCTNCCSQCCVNSSN